MGLTELVRALLHGGAKPALRDNWGRTPFQIALRQTSMDPAYAAGKIGPLHDMLAPSSLKLKVGGRLIKLDRHTMEFFLLHSMLAVFQHRLRHKIERDLPAFETDDFVFTLNHFPEPVIPERRRNRPYITSVLARNEMHRPDASNRRLFVRVNRGFYLPNPLLEIEVEEAWVNLYDVIHLEALEQEQDDAALQHAIRYIRGLHSVLAGSSGSAPPA